MKNLYIYIISVILVFAVVAVYFNDLLEYGLSHKTAFVIIAFLILIIAVGYILVKILNNKLKSKDNSSN